MNTRDIYAKAIAPPKPKVEETLESPQMLINDERAQWLQHRLTMDLLNFLIDKRSKLLEEVVSLAYADQEKIRARLHQAVLLKDIINYARTNNTTN